jgi:hypothetical protein
MIVDPLFGKTGHQTTPGFTLSNAVWENRPRQKFTKICYDLTASSVLPTGHQCQRGHQSRIGLWSPSIGSWQPHPRWEGLPLLGQQSCLAVRASRHSAGLRLTRPAWSQPGIACPHRPIDHDRNDRNPLIRSHSHYRAVAMTFHHVHEPLLQPDTSSSGNPGNKRHKNSRHFARLLF